MTGKLYLTAAVLGFFLGCADIPDDLREEAKTEPPSLRPCESVFNDLTHFCYDGGVYPRCNGVEYNPSTHICQGSVANPARCNGRQYNPLEQRCQGDVVEARCGAGWYDAAAQFCHSGGVYPKCGGKDYDPANQRCQGNVVEARCGAGWYDAANQRCGANNVIETRCGVNGWYNPATHFCQSGTNEVLPLCGGTLSYASTFFCRGNSVLGRCGGNEYDPATHYCVDGAASTSKGKFADARDNNKIYEYLTIGSQTWMAENLNYDVNSSRCHGDNTGSDSRGNCAKYGRLYNWAAAMGLEASCNAYSCASKIDARQHRGVCPSGWHIPSNAEWDELYNFAGGSSVAGKHLKAKDGWDSCGPSGSGESYSCEDTYGFAALPGGYGLSGGGFGSAGNIGSWWSSSEGGSSFAYYRDMGYGSEGAYWANYGKSYLFSVRCAQD